MPTQPFDRRMFLARTGLLGMAAATPGLLLGAASPAAAADPISDLLGWLRPQLDALSTQTFDALVAFIVPGQDSLSRGQGTPRPEAGAVEAGIGPYAMNIFDRYIPFPDAIELPLLTQSAKQVGNVPAKLPAALKKAGHGDAQRLDKALDIAIQNNETFPAAILVTLLLNATATLIHPDILFRWGTFDSLFARCSYAEKAQVFADFESPQPRLLGLLKGILSPSLLTEFNGLLKFISGALLAIPSLGMFSEWPRFNPTTKTLTERPPGWDLSNYLPGLTVPPDGQPDFLGYYQGKG